MEASKKKLTSPKLTGTLKSFVDAGKKNTRVLQLVERWLLAQPKDTSRRTDVIHPSAMVKPDWCHRAEYFLLQGATPAPSKYKTSMKQTLTFEEGHRIHARWQHWFAQMGNLYGKWECVYCDETFMALSPKTCEFCGDDRLVYREVSVYSAAHGISGHADGWLKGFDGDLLLEIKSVGEGTFRWEALSFWLDNDSDFKKAWKNLKTPVRTHIMQAQVYMKLLELMYEGTGVETPQEALFIYESKVDQEVKEFVVPKSDFDNKDLFEAATRIMESIKKQVPPMCNINTSNNCSKCEVYDVN
jgi:hypothetical protein